MKLCTKNYENPSIFVKVTAKKSVAPFFLDTVYTSVSTYTMSENAVTQFQAIYAYIVFYKFIIAARCYAQAQPMP